ASEDNEDPPYPYPTSSISYGVEKPFINFDVSVDKDETEEAVFVEEPFEPNFAWDKGKTKEIKEIIFDFADDEVEIEEAWYVEEPSKPMSVWDKGKAKEIKKRIVESAISDQNLNISP
ncbi:hypothetical protein A2U01_0008250, partial [Trifolium medium]|nr:hypothetical protein [Trifolium medium]